MSVVSLVGLGWTPAWEQQLRALGQVEWQAARVAREERDRFLVFDECGELSAEIAGRLRPRTEFRSELPAVGDWVAITVRPARCGATIHAVLPRVSKFSRKQAGPHTEEQILAANVDTAFLVCGLDGDYNPRRIERYLTVAWDSGAVPVLVLNKADLCADVAGRVAEVESLAVGVPVHAVSARENQGLECLSPYLTAGKTVVFLGSSGVGKSSLINRFVGEERQRVLPVREGDSHGRHTTTHRELIPLSGGGVLIDTPGLRELQLWHGEEALPQLFGDVEELIARCRFSDCRHATEPGCAVLAAIEDGSLPAERYRSYVKLQRELQHMAAKQDVRLREAVRQKWKDIAAKRRTLNRERGS